MSELLNTVDDVQGLNVEGQDPGADEGATPAISPEGEQPAQEVAKPAQTPEENAKFKEIRQLAEQKAAELAQQKIDQFYRDAYAGQINPFTGLPIDSQAAHEEYERQQAIHKMAENSGVSVQEQEALLKKALLGLPEYQQTAQEAEKAKQEVALFRQAVVKDLMEKDLATIKKAYPKETAKSVEELGPTYFKAVELGLGAVEAYEIALRAKQRVAPPPPSMGDINNGGADEAEHYTLEQLKSMSQEEIHKNWDKVQKSRKHIFK